jgi:DNA-binding ferritin-like protein
MGYINKAKEVSSKSKSGSAVASLVVEMMDAATKFHILHLSVKGPGSFAAHKALGDLYEELPGFADTLAESYQGVTGALLDYPTASAPTM